jgi:hypothetical protein
MIDPSGMILETLRDLYLTAFTTGGAFVGGRIGMAVGGAIGAKAGTLVLPIVGTVGGDLVGRLIGILTLPIVEELITNPAWIIKIIRVLPVPCPLAERPRLL